MKLFEIFCILCICLGFVEGEKPKYKKVDFQTSKLRSQKLKSRKQSISLRKKTYKLQEDKYLHLPKSCAHADSDIISIGLPYMGMGSFAVLCENKINGNWLVVLNRYDGSVDFHRPWSEYKKGFGTLNGEFFIGLEKLRILTTFALQELLIMVEDFDGEKEYAIYNEFIIGSEKQSYKLLKLGNYTGSLGDTFRDHEKQCFVTYDRDSDKLNVYNCATMYHGGWWYDRCEKSGLFLTAAYGAKRNYFHKRLHALEVIQMMIRPVAAAN